MLVSVIIPTYNRKDFLKKAIDSVLTQSFHDWELIVVDDGSDLESRKQLAESCKQNPQISYFYRSHKGPAAARNFGVSVAKGKYIAFLDSDDTWDKYKSEKQIKALKENPDHRICYTNGIWLRNSQWVNQKKKHQKQSGYIFERSLELCIISCSTVVMEKSLFEELGGFDESFPTCEDYEFWLRVTAKEKVLYLEEKLFTRNAGHSDQLSEKYWGMDRFRIRAIEKLLQSKNLTTEQKEQTKKELLKKIRIFYLGALKRKKWGRFMYYYFKSIRTLFT